MRRIALLLLMLSAFAKAETLHMASLSWPPYTGSTLEHQGPVIERLRGAIASQGQYLSVDFLPWQRALLLMRTPSQYMAFGPAYDAPSRREHFIQSDVVGYSPLGIAYRRGDPVQWQNLSDLHKLRIGVVRDYVNTDAFDTDVRTGRQPVDYADTDRQNLLKLAYGRVDAIVIDRQVLYFLLAEDPALAPFRGDILMADKLLANKPLYITFRNSATGHHWRDLLNKGLKATQDIVNAD